MKRERSCTGQNRNKAHETTETTLTDWTNEGAPWIQFPFAEKPPGFWRKGRAEACSAVHSGFVVLSENEDAVIKTSLLSVW